MIPAISPCAPTLIRRALAAAPYRRHARHPLAGLAHRGVRTGGRFSFSTGNRCHWHWCTVENETRPLRPQQSRGLTLVEVLLVLALLVVIGAISVPLMEGTFSRASLHSGGDLVRAAWARARLAAMQSGQTHVFRFELNGSRFQILPLANLGLPEANDLQPADPEERYDPSDMLLAVRNRLPEDVTFVAGDVATSSHVTATEPDLGQSPWSPPVLFHPDGTTSDAWIVLANEHDRRIRVTLRGLTGVSNVSEILEEAPR